jgi:hypothetical protein
MAKDSDDPYYIGKQRRPQKQGEPNQDEPKTKAEVLAVTWGLTRAILMPTARLQYGGY